MTTHQEALSIYNKALKAGRKYYDEMVRDGLSPYLPVLDAMVPDLSSLPQKYLGIMDIPIDMIAGTKTSGRQDAFAGNFCPLLDSSSEFGMKWIALLKSHISEGIREPVRVFEYLGKFYVQEGNKRVSVLKSMDALKVTANVTRIMPSEKYTDPGELAAYKSFLAFYELSGLYTVHLSNPNNYMKLQASLSMEPGQVWTEEERNAFTSRLFTFTNAFNQRKKESDINITPSDALLCWLQVYRYEDLKTIRYQDLLKTIDSVWPELMLLSGDKNEPLSMKPGNVQKTFISKLFSQEITMVSAAFIHYGAPSASEWVRGHESGAQWMKNQLPGRVSVKNYYCTQENAEETMEKAISDGAMVMFVTAPTLIYATRRVSVMHPGVIILTCALSMPMAGVRSYYSRIYEAKFVAGAIAAAMTNDNEIGYIAKYPIFGVPAEINAFSLGARMTNQNVRIKLKWTGRDEDPYRELTESGITTISGMDIISRAELNDPHKSYAGTFIRDENGKSHILSAPCWYWGTFYERVMRYIINDEWNEVSVGRGGEVDYWWGLDSGVIDVKLSDELPPGVMQLAKILKKGIISGGIDIFKTLMTDKDGVTRNDGSRSLEPLEIMKMDWLLENIDGEIPAFEELLPMARNLTRILGVYRDEIPPEKEGFLL